MYTAIPRLLKTAEQDRKETQNNQNKKQAAYSTHYLLRVSNDHMMPTSYHIYHMLKCRKYIDSDDLFVIILLWLQLSPNNKNY